MGDEVQQLQHLSHGDEGTNFLKSDARHACTTRKERNTLLSANTYVTEKRSPYMAGLEQLAERFATSELPAGNAAADFQNRQAKETPK